MLLTFRELRTSSQRSSSSADIFTPLPGNAVFRAPSLTGAEPGAAAARPMDLVLGLSFGNGGTPSAAPSLEPTPSTSASAAISAAPLVSPNPKRDKEKVFDLSLQANASKDRWEPNAARVSISRTTRYDHVWNSSS